MLIKKISPDIIIPWRYYLISTDNNYNSDGTQNVETESHSQNFSHQIYANDRMTISFILGIFHSVSLCNLSVCQIYFKKKGSYWLQFYVMTHHPGNTQIRLEILNVQFMTIMSAYWYLKIEQKINWLIDDLIHVFILF